VLQWSSYLADLARRQSNTSLVSLASLYQTVSGVNTSSIANFCNASAGLAVVGGACTLQPTATEPQTDQCGPFSCFGFAMVALLCFLVLSTAVLIYCCTRWRSRVARETCAKPDAPIAVNVGGGQAAVTDDLDDDPFADFDKAQQPKLQSATSTATVSSVAPKIDVPVSPRRGPIAENSIMKRPMAAEGRSVSPSPRRPSVVRIREPHEAQGDVQKQTVTLPRALSGQNLNAGQRVEGFTSSIQPPTPIRQQPTMDEEKRQLESQPWIWKHVQK
jgi:hypothetical protein